MATKPTNIRASAHHGYKSWTSTYYDDTGHRRTKRFGRVGQVTKKQASVAYESWLKREWGAKQGIRNPDDKTYTVERMARTYYEHAKAIYKKRGKQTTHIAQVAAAMNALIDDYGPMAADSVGAPEITRLLDKQVHAGKRKNRTKTLGISTINGRLRIIKQAYAWARSYGHVCRESAYDVSIVKPLRAGRTAATAPVGVKPVPDDVLAAVLKHCPPTVADAINLMIHSGMRSGEMCVMRPCDIEVRKEDDGEVWIYRPSAHKTEHHGKSRVIVLGAKSIAILRPYIERRGWSEPVFTPMDAHRERLEMNGKPKVLAYQTSRSVFKPGRAYTNDTFRNAVQRACDRAFDPDEKRRTAHDWSYRIHPHQFRHNAATRLRKEFGIEAATDVLGHSTFNTSLIYAERAMSRMIEVAKKAG